MNRVSTRYLDNLSRFIPGVWWDVSRFMSRVFWWDVSRFMSRVFWWDVSRFIPGVWWDVSRFISRVFWWDAWYFIRGILCVVFWWDAKNNLKDNAIKPPTFYTFPIDVLSKARWDKGCTKVQMKKVKNLETYIDNWPLIKNYLAIWRTGRRKDKPGITLIWLIWLIWHSRETVLFRIVVIPIAVIKISILCQKQQ